MRREKRKVGGAHILEHLVGSDDEVIVSDKAGQSCGRAVFYILEEDGFHTATSTSSQWNKNHMKKSFCRSQKG